MDNFWTILQCFHDENISESTNRYLPLGKMGNYLVYYIGNEDELYWKRSMIRQMNWELGKLNGRGIYRMVEDEKNEVYRGAKEEQWNI